MEWIAFAEKFPRDENSIYVLCNEDGDVYLLAKLESEYVDEYENQQNPPKCWYFIDLDDERDLEACEGDMGFWTHWAVLQKCEKCVKNKAAWTFQND